MINRATLQTSYPLFTDASPKPYPNTQNITSIFNFLFNDNSGNKKTVFVLWNTPWWPVCRRNDRQCIKECWLNKKLIRVFIISRNYHARLYACQYGCTINCQFFEWSLAWHFTQTNRAARFAVVIFYNPKGGPNIKMCLAVPHFRPALAD